MILSGKLNQHLMEIDETAKLRLNQLMEDLMNQNNITENLKSENPILWTQLMNNMKSQAEEIILSELIYS